MVVIGCIWMPLAAAAAPVRIAILPFSIHADKDYAFLQKGIAEMLASRLSVPEKVVVIDPALTVRAAEALRGKSSESLARQAGAELKADYAVHGSITILGESVSIDAVTVDINGSRPALTFFKQTQDLGGVIPQVDRLAEEINTRLLGLAPRATGAQGAAGPPPAAAGRPQAAPPVQPDVHKHPEKLLQKSPFASSQTEEASGQTPSHRLNPAFQAAYGDSVEDNTVFWKSRNYDHMINSIDVGDVDRDGLLETVVATPEKIIIYRFAQGRQETIAEIETGNFLRNISVSIGDINRNGTPEIFVTALTIQLNALESYVLEYDGAKFKPLVEKSRYYYSVVQHPTLGTLLLGQRQASSVSTPFDAPVFEMTWKGADYEPDRQILPGRKASLLGLVYGDIMNSGGDSIAAFDPYDHLQVILPGGKVEWKDDDVYGGTVLYFALPPNAPGDGEQPFYLPVRIRSADLDKDGKNELIVFRNEGGTGRKLGVRRYFKNSRIEALGWDGLALHPLWKTRQLSGRIQDLVVADFDNDGADEILAAVVSKEGAIIFTDARSSLIAYDLSRPK